jgi:NTE family protein
VKQKISLVLSGGGARGIAHIGVIEELEKKGFEIVSIAGTSMGALVGAIYANGKLNAYKEWLLTLKKMDVFKLMDFTISKQGFVKGDKIFKKMTEYIGDVTFEDLSIPLSVTATNISLNKEVVFTSGSLAFALRASVAIPTVLTPVKHNGHFLIDGGVINNLPISNLKRFKNDILVVVDVNANSKPSKPNLKMNYFDIMGKSISILIEKISEHTIEIYKPDIVVQIPNNAANVLDFYKAKKMIKLGRDNANIEIEKYLLK